MNLYFNKYERVANLSRGMKQRLALARLLLPQPDLILYDEPFTGLDREGQKLLIDILKKQQNDGKLQVLVTHKSAFLTGINYRKYRLERGELVEGGDNI